MSDKVFIIAEAGVNHNGRVSIAKRLIDAAAASGADAVKFQTFTAENLVLENAPKAEYQKKQGVKESHFDMLKNLELDRPAHKDLIAHCRKKGIVFMSSPFDLDSIDLLEGLGIGIFKIPSGEITNLPYLKKIGALKKRIILSTGMANLGEIGAALDVLDKAGTGRKDITVMHCNTAYPTPAEDVNLRAMITIKKALDVDIGYSDHTQGIEVPIAAAALGAKAVEKHLTLDRSMKGPDHAASLEPDEFKHMVTAIRNIEKALGDGTKSPSASESKNIGVVRKSLVAMKDIKKGDIFSSENLTAKRPGGGISPMRYDELAGKKAKIDFKKGEMIKKGGYSI